MPPFATLNEFLERCAISWAQLTAPKEELQARELFAPVAFPDSQVSLKCAQCGYGLGVESIDLHCVEKCVNCGWSRECGAP